MQETQSPQPQDGKTTTKTITNAGGVESIGVVSQLAGKTWEDVVDESYGHLKLSELEKSFGPDADTYDRFVKTELKKMLRGQNGGYQKTETGRNVYVETWSYNITDRSKYGIYGPPLVLKPRYHPLVLRDLAEHDPDVSAGLDAWAVNTGEVNHTLITRVPYTTEPDGTVKRADTGEAVNPVEWQLIQRQRKEAESFVNRMFPGKTFKDARSHTERVKQELGNCYWAVNRAEDGTMQGCSLFVDDATIRLCEEDNAPVEIEYRYFEGDEIKTQQMEWVFRRYVQSVKNKKRYYKSFNDPRFLDRDTGIYYNSADEAPAGAVSAQEIIHHRAPVGIHYGRPTWVPAAYGVQSNKAARLVNRETLSNSGIPKMAVLITNSRDVSLEKTIKRSFQKVKDSGNREMIMVVRVAPEGVGAGPTEKPVSADVKFEKFSDLQEKQGMFLDLQTHNRRDIDTTFRIPGIFYGRSEPGLNYATAFIMQSTAERQVFAPVRQRFDAFMNDVIFVEMGFNHWQFVSQSPDVNDAQLYLDTLRLFGDFGALTPNDLRGLSGELLDLPLDSIPDEWASLPKHLASTAAGMELQPGELMSVNTGQAKLAAFAQDVLKSHGLNITPSEVSVYAYQPGDCCP